jgi:outer membrane cobalamin receptor
LKLRRIYHTLRATWLFVFYILFVSNSFPQTTPPTPARIDSSTVADLDSLGKSRPGKWSVNRVRAGRFLGEDIVDFVRLLPNVLPLDLGSLGQFSPVAFRGATPQEGTVLFDGLLFEDPILGFLNSNTIPINLVDEFSFGGAGALAPFGVQAPAGILQINTYQFQANQPYSKVNFRTGDWGYSDLGIVFALPLSKSSSFMIGGSRQELDGFVLNSDHTGSRVQIRLSYHPHSQFSLNYSILLNRNNVEVPAPLLPDFSPGVSNARRKESRSDQVVSLKFGDLQKSSKQVLARVFFSRLLQQSFGDSLLFKNRNHTLGAGVQFDWLSGIHEISLGGEFKIYDLNSFQLKDNTDQFGHMFVRDKIRFAENWKLGIQGRLEKHDDYSVALNSSGNLNYALTPEANIWFGVQTSRRYPSFAERYWPTPFFQGDPNLSQEKGTAFEIGFSMNRENSFTLETALFRHEVEDWIGQTVLADSTAFGPRNLGFRTVHGLDLKFVWNYLPAGQFGFIGSFLQVEEDTPEKQLQVPEYSIYSYVQMGRSFFQDYVFVTLRLVGRLFGERSGLIYQDGSVFPETTTLGQTAVLDGKMTFEFAYASMFLAIENLLDKKYQRVPGFYMPPKTFRFGIEWELWN